MKIANDIWVIVTRYTNVKTHVQLACVNRYLHHMILTNQIQRVWDVGQVGVLIEHTKSPLIFKAIEFNWITDFDNLFKIACISRREDVAKLLLENGKVNFDNENTPLYYACIKNCPLAVELLLQNHQVDPSILNDYILVETYKRGHFEIVKRLLQDSRVNPSVEGNFILKDVSKNNNLELAKILLQNEKLDLTLDVYDFHENAIGLAIENDHMEMTKLLLQKAQDNINAIVGTLQKMLTKGHIKMFKDLILDPRFNNAKFSKTFMVTAIVLEKESAFEYILQNAVYDDIVYNEKEVPDSASEILTENPSMKQAIKNFINRDNLIKLVNEKGYLKIAEVLKQA